MLVEGGGENEGEVGGRGGSNKYACHRCYQMGCLIMINFVLSYGIEYKADTKSMKIQPMNQTVSTDKCHLSSLCKSI